MEFEKYDYLKLEEELSEREQANKNNGKPSVYKVSDWNSSIKEVSVPLALYVEAFGKSLLTLTNYPETSVTKKICKELIESLHSQGVKNVSSMHLYGSGTQAINMLFFSLGKIIRSTSINEKTILFVNPTYFSAFDSAKSQNFNVDGDSIFRLTEDNFQINLDLIQDRIRYWELESKPVQALFITEPVYSAGKNLSPNELKNLSMFCKKNDIYLLIDGSFSGLKWNELPNWRDNTLVHMVEDHVALVDSISKKLFFLNTKIGVLYGSKKIIDTACDGADWLSGNITALQQELAKMAFMDFSKEKPDNFSQYARENIKKFQERFEKIISTDLLQDSQYFAVKPDAGYHVLVLSKNKIKNKNVDIMKWNRNLLKLNIFALATLDFNYSDNDVFGFRVSLTRDHDFEILKSVINQSL